MQQIYFKRNQMIKSNRQSRRQAIFSRTRKIIEQQDEVDNHDTQPFVSINLGNQQKNALQSHFNQSMIIEAQKPSSTFQKNKEKKSISSKVKSSHKKHLYYRNFQFPVWMTSIPQSLQHKNEYYMAIRPAAERVFIYFKANCIQLISHHGQIRLKQQLSIVGSKTKKHHNHHHNLKLQGTLLQGYYCRQNKLVTISDLLIWRKNPMSSSQFDFRINWLGSNFTQPILQGFRAQTNLQFKFMQYQLCTRYNLLKLYKQQLQNMQKNNASQFSDCGGIDGILFIQKQSFYEHQEVNPQVLLWKDSVVSKWINTSVNTVLGTQKNYQSISSNVNSSQSAMNEMIQQSYKQHWVLNQTPLNSKKLKVSSQQLQDIQQQLCRKQINQISLTNNMSHYYQPHPQHFFYGILQKNEIRTYDGWLLGLGQVSKQKYQLNADSLSSSSKKFQLQQMQSSSQQSDAIIVKCCFDNIVQKNYQNFFHQKNKDVKQRIIENQVENIEIEIENQQKFQIDRVCPFHFINLKVVQSYDIDHRVPDSLSKIIFKFNYVKASTPTIQQLLNALPE